MKMKNLQSMGEGFVLELIVFPQLKMRHLMTFLKKAMSLIQEAKCDIPEVVIDRAHRISNDSVEENSKKLCKTIIVRFLTFTHRTKFYRSRIKPKNNVKVKLDLTKSRYTIFTKVIETNKQSNVADYVNVMVHITCWLKVVFENGQSNFFADGDSLKRAIEEEIN